MYSMAESLWTPDHDTLMCFLIIPFQGCYDNPAVMITFNLLECLDNILLDDCGDLCLLSNKSIVEVR